jgi:hypothetical protein
MIAPRLALMGVYAAGVPNAKEKNMRITRMTIEGTGGRVEIERPRGATTILVTGVTFDPRTGERQDWKSEISSHVDADELLNVARRMQRDCDGVRGTNSDIHDYFRELQRFAD